MPAFNMGGSKTGGAPTQSALATSTTGGTIPAGTYYYVVTAILPTGESLASNEQSITTTGSTSSNTVTWTTSAGATGYRIRRGATPGGENVYWTVGVQNNYVDANVTSTPGSPPTAVNAAMGNCVVANPLACAKGSTLDKDSSNNASTGGLNTGIGVGPNQVIDISLPGTPSNTQTVFRQNGMNPVPYMPGHPGGAPLDGNYLWIGGGRCNANSNGLALANPWNTCPLVCFGNGSNRGDTAWPFVTGTLMMQTVSGGPFAPNTDISGASNLGNMNRSNYTVQTNQSLFVVRSGSTYQPV